LLLCPGWASKDAHAFHWSGAVGEPTLSKR
jgi:hypothetical protein